MVIMLTIDFKTCDPTPVKRWIGVYFMVITAELFIQEMKDRMSESLYWQTNRRFRKRLTYFIAITKEIVDYIWIVYGIMIFWTGPPRPDKCTNEFYFTFWMINLFIVLGLMKLALYGFVALVFLYIAIQRCRARQNERRQSVDILRSLSRVRFSALHTI